MIIGLVIVPSSSIDAKSGLKHRRAGPSCFTAGWRTGRARLRVQKALLDWRRRHEGDNILYLVTWFR
jgi:hypothetical protein